MLSFKIKIIILICIQKIIEVNDSGNKFEIGFWDIHTLSRFVKPTKAFLSNVTISSDSKFNCFKLTKSLKVPFFYFSKTIIE